MLQGVEPGRGGVHPTLESLARRRARPARLGSRLRLDGQIGCRILNRFVGSGSLAGPHREHQTLPADRPSYRRLEPKGLGGDLVERLQHRDLIARAPHHGCGELLGDLRLRCGGRCHVLGVNRRTGGLGWRGRHRGRRSLLRNRAPGGLGVCRRMRRLRRRLSPDRASEHRRDHSGKPELAILPTRRVARVHDYSGVHAS